MATFTYPHWAKPVMDFYALNWPDVDEDAVAQFGHQVQRLANDTYIFSLTVRTALEELAEQSRSLALTTMAEEWGKATSQTVEPICDGIGSSAVTSTLVAANSITVYKGSVLGILTINVGTDIACIATGVGVVAVAAKKAVVRQTLQLAMEELARHTAAWVVQQFVDAIEDTVLKPLEQIAHRAVDDLTDAAARIISMAVPPVTGAGGASAAGALYIEHQDVLAAAAKIRKAYDRIARSTADLVTWSKGSGYTTPTPMPDRIVSDEIKRTFDWVGDTVSHAIEQLGENIIDQIVRVLTQAYVTYEDADDELGRRAQQLRSELSLPVRSAPFMIDRSTRPEPVMVVDGPPPVITGVAVSDAREGIVTTDLHDAPAPVVTGSAESDAARSIRDLILGDPPEPVVTGTADSDAHHGVPRPPA